MPVERLAVVSLAVAAALEAASSGGSDTRTQFTHLVLTYTGAPPPAGVSSIQEDFPCHGR